MFLPNSTTLLIRNSKRSRVAFSTISRNSLKTDCTSGSQTSGPRRIMMTLSKTGIPRLMVHFLPRLPAGNLHCNAYDSLTNHHPIVPRSYHWNPVLKFQILSLPSTMNIWTPLQVRISSRASQTVQHHRQASLYPPIIQSRVKNRASQALHVTDLEDMFFESRRSQRSTINTIITEYSQVLSRCIRFFQVTSKRA